MSVNVHIEQIGDTRANYWSNLDLLQIGILTDQNEELLWANSDKSKIYISAPQYYYDGSVHYCNVNFNEATLHSDLVVSEYIKRLGGTDDRIRLQNDQIDIDAGGINALRIEDSQTIINPNGVASYDAIIYNNSSDTTALLRISQVSTGDATISQEISGGTSWYFGPDNSDSDKWKISIAAGFGSNYLNISTTGEVSIPLNLNVGAADSNLVDVKGRLVVYRSSPIVYLGTTGAGTYNYAIACNYNNGQSMEFMIGQQTSTALTDTYTTIFRVYTTFLLPGVTSTMSIGDSAYQWLSMYCQNYYLKNYLALSEVHLSAYPLAFPITKIGSTSSGAISLNYDPSSNTWTGNSGNGTEIYTRYNSKFIVPNSGDTTAYNDLAFNEDDVHLVLGGGNVGIYDNTPDSRLSVNGSINQQNRWWQFTKSLSLTAFSSTYWDFDLNATTSYGFMKITLAGRTDLLSKRADWALSGIYIITFYLSSNTINVIKGDWLYDSQYCYISFSPVLSAVGSDDRLRLTITEILGSSHDVSVQIEMMIYTGSTAIITEV